MTMTTPLVVGIGTEDAQKAFLQTNKPFLDEYHLLLSVVKAVFLNRVIYPPSDEVIASLIGLPDEHPQVMAVDDKYKSDLIVYTLGRIALDDFGELIVLAGNGWGVGGRWRNGHSTHGDGIAASHPVGQHATFVRALTTDSIFHGFDPRRRRFLGRRGLSSGVFERARAARSDVANCTAGPCPM